MLTLLSTEFPSSNCCHLSSLSIFVVFMPSEAYTMCDVIVFLVFTMENTISLDGQPYIYIYIYTWSSYFYVWNVIAGTMTFYNLR